MAVLQNYMLQDTDKGKFKGSMKDGDFPLKKQKPQYVIESIGPKLKIVCFYSRCHLVLVAIMTGTVPQF